MDKRDKLSQREKEILYCLFEGMTTKESASRLYISFDTVKTHRRNLLRKLEAKNNVHLAIKAIQTGIIQISKPDSFELQNEFEKIVNP